VQVCLCVSLRGLCVSLCVDTSQAFSLSLSLSLSLPRSRARSLSLSLALALYLSPSRVRTHTTSTRTHKLPLSLPRVCARALSHSRTHTLTLAHTRAWKGRRTHSVKRDLLKRPRLYTGVEGQAYAYIGTSGWLAASMLRQDVPIREVCVCVCV